MQYVAVGRNLEDENVLVVVFGMRCTSHPRSYNRSEQMPRALFLEILGIFIVGSAGAFLLSCPVLSCHVRWLAAIDSSSLLTLGLP